MLAHITVLTPGDAKPDVQPGDGIVMYASGWGVIFAAAEATSYPYEHDTSPWPWRVDVNVLAARDHIRNGKPLQALAVDGREHNVRIRRRSHVSLTGREFEAAVEVLGNA